MPALLDETAKRLEYFGKCRRQGWREQTSFKRSPASARRRTSRSSLGPRARSAACSKSGVPLLQSASATWTSSRRADGGRGNPPSCGIGAKVRRFGAVQDRWAMSRDEVLCKILCHNISASYSSDGGVKEMTVDLGTSRRCQWTGPGGGGGGGGGGGKFRATLGQGTHRRKSSWAEKVGHMRFPAIFFKNRGTGAAIREHPLFYAIFDFPLQHGGL